MQKRVFTGRELRADYRQQDKKTALQQLEKVLLTYRSLASRRTRFVQICKNLMAAW
jgi:hypothetical protein